MKLGKFTQAPDEVKKYSLDYTLWLETAETITGKVFKITNTTVPPVAVTFSAITLVGKGLVFFVSGGVDGDTYRVAIEVTTSIGQVKEDYLQIDIKDPGVIS